VDKFYAGRSAVRLLANARIKKTPKNAVFPRQNSNEDADEIFFEKR
jgi:hypothetical protein